MTCAVSPAVLSNPFPPNHNLVNVGLTASASDVCNGSLPVAVAVFANEDDETPTAPGEVYSPDAANLAVGALRLRYERLETGKGRVYLVVTSARDSSGNTGATCCTVVVPHDLKAASLQSVQNQAATAQSFCRTHNGTPLAGYVRVGDGPVIGSKQ